MEPGNAVHTVNIRREGVTLICAHFRFSTPDIPLYHELAALCETWLRGTLATKAREEYEACPSTNKRFFFSRYEYLFEVTELSRTDKSVTVRHLVTLAQRGGGEIARYESHNTHRLPDHKLVRPRRVRSRVGKSSDPLAHVSR